MAPKAEAKVYGPYDVVSRVAQDGVPFLTLPFAQVRNSQILISLKDNATAALVAASQSGNTAYLIVMAEVSFWGSVQGFATCLKRQALKSTWGPAIMSFGDEDVYDQFSARIRLFIGGKPGIPSDIVFAAPLAVTCTVHIQPREGIG